MDEDDKLNEEQFRRVWQRVMPQDRPESPIALDPPRRERLLEDTRREARICRDLARRWPGESLFRRLAEDYERQEKRLRAAHFLNTGRPWKPAPEELPPPAALPLALRDRYRACRAGAEALERAAGETRDPHLSRLYRDIQKERLRMAEAILRRLGG